MATKFRRSCCVSATAEENLFGRRHTEGCSLRSLQPVARCMAARKRLPPMTAAVMFLIGSLDSASMQAALISRSLCSAFWRGARGANFSRGWILGIRQIQPLVPHLALIREPTIIRDRGSASTTASSPKERRTPAIPRDASGRERQRGSGLQTLACPANHSAC